MRWFETPNFDFVGKRKIAYVISAVLIVISLFAIVSKGLQYGIDFKGGKEFVYKFQEPVNSVEIREMLTSILETAPEVKRYGEETEVLIRTENTDEIGVLRGDIERVLAENFPNNSFENQKSDFIGPRFADDLKRGAIESIIYAIILIFIYIFIRFRNWTFSAGAVLALIHDVTITLGIFTILTDWVNFSLQIDQTIIAAFLTIVGYSLNDTVVVFDRIRENSIVHKGMDFIPMVNKSLNDTLSRTVITSLTTMFVVAILFIFGGEVLKGFSFALILGIILGTYSSLYVASALVVELKEKPKK